MKMAITIIIALLVIAKLIELKREKDYKKTDYAQKTKKTYKEMLNDKGNNGEYKTAIAIKDITYPIELLYNCYLKKDNGDTTEVDIIAISRKGVFVIENKNYNGWINGDEKYKNWIDSYPNKKKYYFYNPVKQNKGHIKALNKMLSKNESIYRSVIVFNDQANLKNIKITSSETYVMNTKDLKGFFEGWKNNIDVLTETEMNEINDKLRETMNVTDEVKKEHIENINQKYNKK